MGGFQPVNATRLVVYRQDFQSPRFFVVVAVSWERSGARAAGACGALEGHQRSLRDVAAALARLGHVNADGPRQQEAPVAADAEDRVC